jgi:hypothetical protein
LSYRKSGVLRFVGFHLRKYRPAFFILTRQPLQMTLQMPLDLTIGFRKKT